MTQNSVANTASVLYNYSNGMLASIQRGIPGSTQTYRLEYDAFGNNTKVAIAAGTNNLDLITNSYGNKNGLLTQQTYANGDTVSYTYDKLGRVKTTTYSDGRVLTYRYTGDGQLYDLTDSKTGYTYQYSYDTLGRLLSSKVSDSNGAILSTRQTYDANNQLTGQFWTMGEDAYSELYTYSKTTGLLATHTPAVGNKLTFGYDTLQRLSTVTGGLYKKTYTYRDVGDNTTNQVSGITYDLPTDVSVGYTYDAMGNIATYTQGDTTYTYTYDAQGQLLSQTGGSKTYTYTYDAAGNIRSASDGTTTKTYTYNPGSWKDLLTSFNGKNITYDANGNPTTYPINSFAYTLTWEEGNRLVGATNGATTYSFTYDSEGLMTRKTWGVHDHRYYYAGGKLLKETYDNTVLEFFYDANGHPYAMKRNDILYYYITNLQGDVIQLTDASGNVLASYTYDPYGNASITTSSSIQPIGYINPLRYRGYYYDTELGLYYLQSRFYDPNTGRFINADAYASTGQGIIGYNMFAYCLNNPVCYTDHNGRYASGENPYAESFQELGKWIADMLSTDENETGKNGKPTAKAATKRCLMAALHCLDISGGVGLGYYASGEYLDLGIEGGMYGNLICFRYSDGTFSYGKEITTLAFVVTLLQEEFGFSDYAFLPDGGTPEIDSWYVVHTEKDSVTIASGAAYFMAGASFSVGFDLNTFLDLMYQLVKDYQ